MHFVKKLVLLIFLVFALVFVLHKQILGAVIRWSLMAKYDCEFAYRSVYWDEKELIFSDLVLFDPSFHAHIEKVSLRFHWGAFPQKLKGHIVIDSPRVTILKKRDLPIQKGGWIDFSVTVYDGTLDWDGLAHFSYIQDQLVLDWGASSVHVTFEKEGIDAEFKQFKAARLNPFLPVGKLLDGQITGRLALDKEQELVAANVKMDQIAFGLPLGLLENVDGTVSYNATLGAKWELGGIGFAQEKQIPFTCQGRGFFKSQWMESEIQFKDAFCKIQAEKSWIFEWQDLQSEHVTLLQVGASLFFPELSSWGLEKGLLNGKASLTLPLWSADFEGTDLLLRKGEHLFSCQKAKGILSEEGGSLTLHDEKFDLEADGKWGSWTAKMRLLAAQLELKGGFDNTQVSIQIKEGSFQKFQFKGLGWIDSHFDFSFKLDGDWTHAQTKIPFHCPVLSKTGNEWAFDFRFVRKMWDLSRLAGTSNGSEIFFHPKSHLLGAPLQVNSCNLHFLDAQVELPWKSVLAADPFLKECGFDISKIPLIENLAIHLQYQEGASKITAESLNPSLQFSMKQTADTWAIDLLSDLNVSCLLQEDGNIKGKGSWKEGVWAEFDGKIKSLSKCELFLPKVHFDLAQVDFYKMEGELTGQGHLVYDGHLEADFDLDTRALKIDSLAIENEGPIHLFYSSIKGALLSGLNIHGPFDCIVDLLEYDANRAHFLFTDAHVHLPGSFLTSKFLQFLDKNYDLDFRANLDFASDFSTFVCTMKEGLIPFDGAARPIENLNLFYGNAECRAQFTYFNQQIRLALDLEEKIKGRAIIGIEETPLTIDWEYEDCLVVHSMEGSFCGLEASFHADSPNNLIGSARLDLTAISEWIPDAVAQAFKELEMGKGYELKGRLYIVDNLPYFKGILCGKQIELFGFQFRTLLAHTDLGPEKVHIYDIKISDSAGIMKVDEILLETKDDLPWTISIPTLTILEMRPSLLQRPGEAVGPISPLVVRELKIVDFKGLAVDSDTWTAKGKAHFINSYKREETVFDLPANVLSRIVGLDLELLIPVCGDLTFDLKDGAFHLLELSNAFSEGKRSEFFLETNPAPTMDLDGNLKVFIKMKQFVLLKLTESFLISIEGKLEDPQFHLRKKRFFGLM
jgi:hypothetical protein